MSMTGLNIEFPIYNADGSSFNNLVIHKATLESVIMSFGDKLTGDVYYKDNSLTVSMTEYVLVDGIKYVLVSPPTILREGMASDNGDLRGTTKYSFVFYHPMYKVGNFPFTDVAVDAAQSQYLSDSKSFSWIGNLVDFIAKINANLVNTEWACVLGFDINSQDPALANEIEKAKTVAKEVFTFDNNFITDACKKGYEEWEIPYTIEPVTQADTELYALGKKFKIVWGYPSTEILDTNSQPFVFKFGQGVGLKNNSRTPKNNKIVTRLVGYGSENNIPYGYPQIRWYGNQDWDYTIDNDPNASGSLPIYKGILGGQYVKLIKHPFTRKNLMPSVFVNDLFNKISPYSERLIPSGAIVANPNYNPDQVLRDYYDADSSYPNPIDPNNPSVEIHQFDVKPELGDKSITNAVPYDNINNDPLVTAIPLDTFLAQITADLNEQYKVTNDNERTALAGLYDILDSDLGERHFSNQGGSYTFKCDVTKDSDYYYVKYVSDNINYDVVCVQRGHTVTPTWNDAMNDDGEYVQSYFKITIPALGFDLYACASITEKMDINMRSGACIGCTFPVQVNWEDYKRNFYNSEGEFDPTPHTQEGDGHVRDITKYPDTTYNAITLIVQKDLDTFGTLMPNVYQQPHSGDKFVILGISLPQMYVTAAQTLLDGDMEEYIWENNVHYFEYPLKFDEYFLATNTNILEQIHNYSIIRFEYPNGGNQMALYVKQMVVKYGEKVLPQYDITLTDDIEIVLNQIGQVTDDVSRMRVQVSELQKYYSENIIQAINEKLSKVVDDVCQGRITFQQGLDSIGNAIFHDELRSPDFTSGLYTGRGWRVDQLGNAEFESVRARSFLEVVELLVNRMQAQEGDTVFSDNDQIDRVDKYVDPTDSSVSYVLSLKEKWEGYYTPQMYGNILKGIINTLAAKDAGVSDVQDSQTVEKDGSNSFFTSWMRVIATHNTDNTLSPNQIRVVLYGDNETPAGRNFEPCELMTMTRWGCINYSTSDASKYAAEGLDTQDAILASIKRRQQVFYISTSEGRIVKLTGVDQPILRNGNYGTTLGILPEFVQNYPVVHDRMIAGRDYLYAQGVVVGDFIKIDVEGNPIPTVVDKGEWQNNTPYYYNKFNETTQQYETHRVRHNGGTWQCLQSQPIVSGGVETYYEPKWNSPYWMLVDGNDNLTIEFVSSKGYSFRRGAVNTDITPHLFYGNVDISGDLEITEEVADEYWNWTRHEEVNETFDPQTGERIIVYTPQDETWNAQHQHMRLLHLSNLDMPAAWSTQNKAIFTCTVTLNDGKTTRIVDNQIIS